MRICCDASSCCCVSSNGWDMGGPKLNPFFSFIGVGVTLEVRLRLSLPLPLGRGSAGLSQATGGREPPVWFSLETELVL